MPAGWVSAGIAAIDAGESIASNQSAASAAKKNNAGAAQLAGAQGSMLNQAENVAQQPFTPYTGTMTAPMSGNQQQAYSLASSTATNGIAQGDNQQATGLISQVANNGWNADTASKYMSPYTAAVTDASVAASNKQYLQSLAGIQSGAAGSGSFGNSREAIQEGQLAADQNLNVGQLTATGNANAYDKAISTWQSDNQQKLAAASAYEQAGMDVTNMTSSQISDLMKTGGVAQVIAQTDLSNQYAQFMRQQNWSAQQLGSLISAVGSAKGSPAQTPAIQSNTANQLLGLGSTVAGLFGGGSSSGSGAPPMGSSGAGMYDSGATTGSNSLSNITVDPGQAPTMPSIEGG
jgi:hypothetical protein